LSNSEPKRPPELQPNLAASDAILEIENIYGGYKRFVHDQTGRSSENLWGQMLAVREVRDARREKWRE
jgi:hypothetical protein